MSDQASQHEKTEKASPYKVREAKKQGRVAKSSDIQHLAALSTLLVFTVSYVSDTPERLAALCRSILISAGHFEFNPLAINLWLNELYLEVFLIAAPLFASLMIVGIIINILQTGPVLSFSLLKPNLKRINPIEGAKRFFSLKLIFEFVKVVLKVIILSVVVYWVITREQHNLFILGHTSVNSLASHWLGLFSKLLAAMLCTLAAISLLDLLFTRWDYMRQMRMTKHEVKEEQKRREGDPLIRQKRRELSREQRKKQGPLSAVKGADFIITNPTHYAVAIRYERSKMVAPQVTCKGAGERALLIKELAYRNQVSVIQSPALARKLYKKVNVDQCIPSSAYAAVANILHQVRSKTGSLTGARPEKMNQKNNLNPEVPL